LAYLTAHRGDTTLKWVERFGLVAAFGVALVLAPAVGKAIGGFRPLAAALLISAMSKAYGRSLVTLGAVELPPGCGAIFELVIGFCAVSLIHLTATTVSGRGALAVLPVDVAVGAVLYGLSRPAAFEIAERAPRTVLFDSALVLMCAALGCFWARETVTAVDVAQKTGVFRTWQDFFLHAAEVTYLRDYSAFAGQSLYLTGTPQPLYHRASYAMSAVFSAAGGVPALEVATTFWMPTGLLLCALSVYVFGAALGGRVAGCAAVALVFLFPDASTYGFRNRFLSFDWLMQMAGGSGYAVALTLLGLSVLARARPTQQARALSIAAVCVGAAMMFRVHVALLASGMLVWFALLLWRPTLTPLRIVGLAVCLALAAGVLLWLESVSLAPHFLTGHRHPLIFLQSVHSQANNIPTPYTAWTKGWSDTGTFLVGYVMLLFAGCGVMVPLLLTAWGLGPLKSMGPHVAAIPVALVLSHVSVILGAPAPAHGDVTDLAHRPFVLIYIVFASLVGAVAGRELARWSERRHGSDRQGLAAVLGLSLVGCVVPLKMGANLQQRWVSNYSLIPIRKEDFEAANFVRSNSKPGEQVLTASADPLAMFVALTERGAFLSRRDLFTLLGGPSDKIARERSAAAPSLSGLKNFEELASFGRSHGVRWYIADSPESQLLPRQLKERCAYCGETVLAFKLY
jgi:hypothetical protein